jgi:D-glycero-D-manno-heptose 1,7-bisphosphate phosphatase
MSKLLTLQPALFLDRDGIVNKECGYISSVKQIQFNSEIFRICRFFKHIRFKIVIVTNQSGIGRKLITEKQYLSINNYIYNRFNQENCSLDSIFTASGNPESKALTDTESFMRKPNPGMIISAQNKLDIDLSKSILIGDNLSDMEAGYAANVSQLMLVNQSQISGDFFESFSCLSDCLSKLQITYDKSKSWDWN